MSDKRTCENCKYFIMMESLKVGVCSIVESDTLLVSPTSSCKHFEPRTNKVKPRRLCDFCERHRPIDDDYGRYSLELTRLIPLPSINLTTGEKTEPKNKTEYVMFIYEDEDDGEVGSFPIKFCPMCGRKLTGEGKK